MPYKYSVECAVGLGSLGVALVGAGVPYNYRYRVTCAIGLGSPGVALASELESSGVVIAGAVVSYKYSIWGCYLTWRPQRLILIVFVV